MLLMATIQMDQPEISQVWPSRVKLNYHGRKWSCHTLSSLRRLWCTIIVLVTIVMPLAPTGCRIVKSVSWMETGDTVVDVKSIGDTTNAVAFPFEYGAGLTGYTVMIQKVGASFITWLQLAEVGEVS